MKPGRVFPLGWWRTARLLAAWWLILSFGGLMQWALSDAPWQKLAAVAMLALLILLVEERRR